jgi:PHP family Zn ribbon phosphoesterase
MKMNSKDINLMEITKINQSKRMREMHIPMYDARGGKYRYQRGGGGEYGFRHRPTPAFCYFPFIALFFLMCCCF